MTVQEWIFSGGALLFARNTLNTARNPRSRVPLSSSLPTAIALSLYVAVHLSLGMIYAALCTALTASGWWLIAARRRT